MNARLSRLFAAFLAVSFAAACGGRAEEVGDDDTNCDDVYEDGKADSATAGKFEVFKGSDGKYYFHLLAANGQNVLNSQAYTSSSAAKTGVSSVAANVPNNARIDK